MSNGERRLRYYDELNRLIKAGKVPKDGKGLSKTMKKDIKYAQRKKSVHGTFRTVKAKHDYVSKITY